MQIGAKNTEKIPDVSDVSECLRGSTDRHRMQQREVSLAHNLLEIMLPHELRTQIIKRMTSLKGEVCTGRDVHTVQFLFVSICHGVARLTNA
jgi:hypothetical protein